MNTRQYYIDWIRLTAFFILIFYHTGMFFVSWGFHIKNNVIVTQIEPIMVFFNQWRLPLLFFISGVGVSFALKSRTTLQFIGERHRRLLIPLIFGMFVIVPPQLYFERLQNDQFTGSFFNFYPKVLEMSPYPDGNFSWHHLWFLIYLLAYCMIALPLFIWLRSEKGQKFLSRLSVISIKPFSILCYSIPLVLIFWILSPKFEVTHNFVWDWFNHAFSLVIFIYGYILGSQLKTWEMVETHRNKYLILSIVLTMLFYSFWPLIGALEIEHTAFVFFIYSIIKVLNIWSIILTICGFFKHYLNKPGKFIKYGTEAVLPFYILHQTITISAGYYLINLQMHWTVKFMILVLVTFGGSWLIYHYIIRPFNFLRFLFGLKPIKSEEYRYNLLKPVAFSVFAIIFLSLTFNLFVWAKPVPQITIVPKVMSVPDIDGILTDSLWKQTLVFKDFKTLNPEPGLIPSESTQLYLAYDSENIYVGINCVDSQPEKIKALDTIGDQLGNEDWVAFCLDTYSSKDGILFFALNANGKQTDGTLDFMDANPNVEKDLQWVSSVARTNNGWSAEMAIPLKQLPIVGTKEVKMRFKLARFISRKAEEVDYPEIHPGSIPHVAQFEKILLKDIKK